MRPPPKDPAAGQQAPHQGQIEVGKHFRLSLQPKYRLLDGGKVTIYHHYAREDKVQEKSSGNIT